ncbi:MAG: hypothetical protein AVDCRST_MAG16-1464 [uncultured Frankineae bacterium]|uniref:Uncharacterized protein n=1 Tax=uncultured Frankineae bacterium TaxID=437475 RepID=A0A6J4LKR2_9ACTN|nr:MAG: hypothetical protein AVDCRST_MAG16-1464 [uncultured Frankineae bacterium]
MGAARRDLGREDVGHVDGAVVRGAAELPHLRHRPHRQVELGKGERVARVRVDGGQGRCAGRQVVRVVQEHEAVVALRGVRHDDLRTDLADGSRQLPAQLAVSGHEAVGPAQEAAVLGAQGLRGSPLLGAPERGDVRARHRGVEAAAVAVGDAQDGDRAALRGPPRDQAAGPVVGVVGVRADDQGTGRGVHGGPLPPGEQVADVPGLVEADQAPPAVPRCGEPRDRAVVGGEPDRPLLAEHRAGCGVDGAGVGEQHGPATRVSGGDALDRVDDPRAEGDRVDVVAVEVAVHEGGPPRVAGRLELLHRDVGGVRAVELRQSVLDLGGHPERLLQRRRGRPRPSRRRAVERRHLVRSQRRDQSPGLLVAALGQLGVGRRAVGGGVDADGKGVPDQDELHGRRR